MAFDYPDARNDAKELIEEFGGIGSVFVPAIPAGERQDDGTFSTGTPEITTVGIITLRLPVTTFEVNGGNIQQGDWYVFFQHNTTNTVEIGMFTTINGVTHRIVEISDITSLEGVNVSLQLFIRGV
ncbi:MAG TPA: hypothetical protein EYN54_02110 [Methylococcaceae bacterium]|nr:hypothetical protein [Methylococcaceae bacterium]